MARRLFATSVFAALMLTGSLAAQVEVNGRNTNFVIFGKDAKELGAFRQETPARWVETGTNHGEVRFRFTETHRDDWSVYLSDDSRGVRLQLDLHTKKVMYQDKNTQQPWQIATILSAHEKTNGWTLRRIQFKGKPNGGWLSQWVDGPVWTLEWTDGTRDPGWYDVVRREDWAVTVRHRDGARATYRIDLAERMVYWINPDGTSNALYPIVSAN